MCHSGGGDIGSEGGGSVRGIEDQKNILIVTLMTPSLFCYFFEKRKFEKKERNRKTFFVKNILELFVSEML